NMVKPCWRPSVEGDGSWRRGGGDPNGRVDGLWWYKDLGHHTNGEFSMAVVQANGLMEDQSQLESGPLSFLESGPCGTFVGVYDGHGGPETSRFVSRSIGDAYLKKSEFNREPLLAKFRLNEPFSKPILSPEPSMLVHKLDPSDQFLIFASDGLWEHLSNQEAVDIVNGYPRNGIARRLVKAALRVAAKKREMRYSDLKKIDRGVRRHFHDDITVVIVFIDQPSSLRRSSSHGSIASIRPPNVLPL
ncbi:protein phosphatase 2C family protein, partial [Striga asiatica]